MRGKNSIKKLIAIVLSLVMYVSSFSVMAFAENLPVEEHEHNKDGWVCTFEEEEPRLICENQEHSHTSECYTQQEPLLICEKEIHSHNEDVMMRNGTLNCTKEEHEHSDACFEQQEPMLTCGLAEHQHTEECYQQTGQWFCTPPEKEPKPEDTEGIEGTATLSIYYYIQETNTPIAPAYIAELLTGSEYSVKSPEIENYTLVEEGTGVVSGVLKEDTKITVYYRFAAETADYTVVYWERNADGSDEKELDRESGMAPIGSVITVPDKSFEGYSREPSDMKLKITADGNAIKNLYYVKNANPNIIFHTEGSYVPVITAEPGADISEQIAELPDPERQGWIFDKWDQELPTEMPAEDLIIHALWKPGISNYIVQYWFQDTVGDGYTRNRGMDEIRQDTTGKTVTASEEDKQKGDTEGIGKLDAFYGFYYSRCEDVAVTGDGKAVLKLYFDREIWKIILYDEPMIIYGIYKDVNKVWMEFEGRYGAPVPSNFPSAEEQRAHYEALELPWINPTLYQFMDTIDLGASHDATTKIVNPVKFSDESYVGTHELKLCPLYSASGYRFTILSYVQSLNDPNDYELSATRTTMSRSSFGALTAIPPGDGFAWKVGDNVGCYRTNTNQETCEKNRWTYPNPSSIDKDGNFRIGRVDRWTELRFLRVKNPITFVSNGDTVSIIEDVYYETPLQEMLKYIPTNGPEGKIFAGWYYSPEDFENGSPVSPQTKMPSTGVMLYAKWEDVDCKVTFDSRGGSSVEEQLVKRYKKATEPPAPVRSGYSFIGWYTLDGTRWSFEREIVQDTTLFAWWRPTMSGGYTVRHIMQSTGELIKESSGNGMVGDTVIVHALSAQDTHYQNGSYLVPDAPTKTIELTVEGSNTATFYYHLGGVKSYKVSYYLKDTEKSLAPDKEVAKTTLSQVTEKAAVIEGYDLIGAYYQTASLLENAENHIVFYYKEKEEIQEPVLQPAKITFKASKLMDGYAPEGEQFAFLLKDENGTVLQEKAAVDGTITFEELTFEKAGNYQYTISEQQGKDSKIEYDSSVYSVKVEVILDKDINAYLPTVTVTKNGKVYKDTMLFLNKTKTEPNPDPPVEPTPDPEEPTITPTPDPEEPTVTPTPDPEEPTVTPTPEPEEPTEAPTPDPEKPTEPTIPDSEKPTEPPTPDPEKPTEPATSNPEKPMVTPVPNPTEAPAPHPAEKPTVPKESDFADDEVPAEDVPKTEDNVSQIRWLVFMVISGMALMRLVFEDTKEKK